LSRTVLNWLKSLPKAVAESRGFGRSGLPDRVPAFGAQLPPPGFGCRCSSGWAKGTQKGGGPPEL